MSNDTAGVRLAVLGVVIISLFAALQARLLYLQVMDTDNFVEAAATNQIRLVYEPAPRGRILDRQGRVLVENRVANVIAVRRDEAERNPEMVDRLAALLLLDRAELMTRINDVRFSPFAPVPVAQDVDESLLVYVLEHQDDFPGVSATRRAERKYPHASLGAHVLGYVGQATREELDARKDSGYRDGDEIGKSGVERTYEEHLRGEAGVTKLEVDARGQVVGAPLGQKPPVPGDDVELTIDLDIQRVAEESLLKGLEAARNLRDREERKPFVAPAGAAVVLDPRDGSVVAMASYPTYEPASFVDGISVEAFRALNDPVNHFPLNNRAIQGLYSPGSTFKLMTSIAALKTGVIDARTTYDDGGTFRLKNCRGDRCVFRNAGSVPHGRVNVARSLTVSSDVFYYTLGASFWTQRDTYGDPMQAAARELGLGRRTGIPLASEAQGRVPDPETRRRLHEANPQAFPNGEWRTGDNINLSIGQGEMAATPLQLAQSYAIFANGGTVYEPRLARRVLDPAGDERTRIDPKTVGRIDLPAEVRAPILAGLRGVVTDPKGTARGAFAGFPLNTFPVAGKTGTAQVHKKQDTALFVAFGPADAPQYVVAVVMEEAGFGGTVAAPVARRIFQALAGQTPAADVTVVEGGNE